MQSILILLALTACDGSSSIKLGDDDTGTIACADGDATADCDNDGVSLDEGDCDDYASSVNPDAEEDCTDGVDNNCNGTVDSDDGSCAGSPDADGDGYGEDVDCDDADASVNPGAAEVCDGVDQNCDGAADENPTNGSDWYADADGDGYGDATNTVAACDQPSGFVSDATDCDDADRVVNPAATEVCGDGVDNNCNAVDDEIGPTWYADTDADGYGDASATTAACDQPTGYAANGTDCADGDATVNPGATEICNSVDDDCDGTADDGFDADGDGAYDAASCSYGTDCDDAASGVYPGAAEVYNAADDDCDGSVDEDFDLDLDGYVDTVYGGDDCDDADASVNPGVAEVCGDSIDNNCNPADDASGSTWYVDLDGDGYGDASVSTVSCAAPVGYVTNADDCDDAVSTTSPAGTEACDGEDNDCDGTTDESDAVDAGIWYPDADGDGYGASGPSVDSCEAPAGYTSDNSDCDDTDALLENDDSDRDGDSTCDGDCDDSDSSLNLDDGDGDGYSTCDGECDDHERTWHPGAAETCDGEDNDCDGTADDGLPTSTWYLDMDGDGYGDGTTPITDCAMPSGTVSDGTDCNDRDSRVSPAAVETCDSEDDDCDGTVDNGFDVDADGAYDEASCSYGTDCDDADATVYPGAAEACDGLDNDCDDGLDEDFDADGDGYADAASCSYGTDCDDADALVSPGGYEVTIDATGVDDLCSNGVDNDCDGATDAADWDCDDDDADTILNGIDVLVAEDGDGDGDDDVLCVVAYDSAMDSPWNTFAGVLQGDSWGGFSLLSASSYGLTLESYADSDGDGSDDVNAWCIDFADAAYAPTGIGAWNFRVVSATAADGATSAPSYCSTASTTTTWKSLDLADFCDWTGDSWCRTGYAANDGCNTSLGGGLIRVDYDPGTSSIAPY